jgi:hypothetical protein
MFVYVYVDVDVPLGLLMAHTFYGGRVLLKLPS